MFVAMQTEWVVDDFRASGHCLDPNNPVLYPEHPLLRTISDLLKVRFGVEVLPSKQACREPGASGRCFDIHWLHCGDYDCTASSLKPSETLIKP